MIAPAANRVTSRARSTSRPHVSSRGRHHLRLHRQCEGVPNSFELRRIGDRRQNSVSTETEGRISVCEQLIRVGADYGCQIMGPLLGSPTTR